MKPDIRKWTITGGLRVLLALSIMAIGCGKSDDARSAGPAAEAAHDEHGPGDGHGHGTSSASIEERASAKCEHEVPIYQCAECRYEVGVVKLDAALLAREGALVRTQTVSRTRVSASLPATGEVALNENATVHISPRIAGVIESVSTDIGARVKPGDTLLTVASVELGRALAEYERNRTLTELAERTFQREKGLREQKVGSEQDVIDAQAAYEQQRAELKASEQMLHVLGLTEDDLSRMQKAAHGPGTGSLPVRAPIAGTIVEKHAVIGELAEPGRDILLLSDLTRVWVWANVHSRDLALLIEAERRGPVAVEISVAAFPGRRFRGTLDYIGATMNEQTRTVKVRATIENSDLALRPGMFCETVFAIGNGQGEEVLAVPRSAVLSDEGACFVFKHWKDDFFARQDVRKGREFFGMVEIIEGLNAGDTVATEGSFLLKSDVLREKMGAGCAD